MTHLFHLRVYYEDTDLAGIVYYANYLKFIERARTEFVRERGVDQGALKRDEGIVFAVRHLEADYLSPAKFDDELTVATSVETLTGARIVLRQVVKRGETALFSALVTLVALTETGQPARLPANIRLLLH
jgi:acyl-CoA thioester hydrolase